METRLRGVWGVLPLEFFWKIGLKDTIGIASEIILSYYDLKNVLFGAINIANLVHSTVITDFIL